MSASYSAEELLKDVVGTLGINSDSAIGGRRFDWIGEELVTVLVDLFRHVATERIGSQIAVLVEFAAEQFHSLADGGHGFSCAVIVEAVAATGLGDTHQFAQAVENLRAPT